MNDKELLRKAIEYLKESLTCCLKRREMEEFVDTYDDWANDLSKQINELEKCNSVAKSEPKESKELYEQIKELEDKAQELRIKANHWTMKDTNSAKSEPTIKQEMKEQGECKMKRRVKMKIRPVEEDFMNWYESRLNTFSWKLSKFLFPNSKRRKQVELTYEKLKKMKDTNLVTSEGEENV